MKKVIISLLVLFVFASCSNETKFQNPVKKDFTFKATCDTCIAVKVPNQSPINLCSGGKSAFSKIISWKDSLVCMKSNQTINITVDSMNANGWYYFPGGITSATTDNTTTSNASNSGSSGSYGVPYWVKWAFWNLFIPFLGLLVFIWLANELIKAINRSNANAVTGGTQQPGTATANATTNQNTASATQQPVSHEVNMETTVVNDFGNQQTPLFVIENSGQGNVTVGNIHIHMNSDGDQNSNQPEKKPATEEAK